jgi:uncharacterized protein (DUF433 family)
MSGIRPTELPDGSVVHRDPEIVSGTPVFVGTRVPVQTFIDHLKGGYTVDRYIEQFPTVRREQVCRFLEQATHALLERVT